VGLQRVARWAVPLAGVALLASGCADDTQAGRLAMPEPASAQGVHILHLWQGAWIAALATGIVVWGLIFFVVIRYRRRSDDEIPVQTRYNLPLEIFYTIAPVIMVVVFFSHTVHTQNLILQDDAEHPPDNIVEVVGQQWSWTFNYGLGDMDNSADDDRTDDKFAYSSYVHDGGTGSYIPELWLPVDETTRFNLHSNDVIHDFGVPSFLMREDVVPGRVNHYVIKPTRIGVYKGKCYELCGVYHSRMLFTVHVVSQEDYQAHLQDLQDQGLTSDKPLLGGENVSTEAGLETTPEDPNGEGK
jgi:cytochrome c oxidase subunit II